MSRLATWVVLLGAIPATAGVTGCSDQAVYGEQGVVAVAYADGQLVCSSRCDPSAPLAVGAEAIVQVENIHELPPLTLRSETPEVLAVDSTYSATHWAVRGVAPGMAVLAFADGTEVIDRFEMEVQPIEEIRVASDSPPLRPLSYEPVEIALELFGPSGDRLRGYGAVTFEAPPSVSVDVFSRGERTYPRSLHVYLGPPWMNDERFALSGDLSGESGQVVFRAGDASLGVDVEVIRPVVTSIALLPRSSADFHVGIEAQFEFESPIPGQVACCEWSLEPEGVATAIDARVCTSAQVHPDDPDDAEPTTVVCTAQGIEGRLRVF
ncbi:MAG: hypothetical protein AB7S26_06550 [Sandaracinaceae bacterium]